MYADEERKNWAKAAAVGKNAINYLEASKSKEGLTPELLFGDALYNYFSVWVPENYPALKPLLLFFRKGDKALGLKQLKEVSYNAFYTRTEAMVWLMRILNSYENDQPRAFQISEYLHQTILTIHTFTVTMHGCFIIRAGSQKLSQSAKVSSMTLIVVRLATKPPAAGMPHFFWARSTMHGRNTMRQKSTIELCMKFAEQIGATESGYYLYSMIALGEIAGKQGNRAEARKWFKEVKKKADRKDEAFKDAKRRLKKMEKGD